MLHNWRVSILLLGKSRAKWLGGGLALDLGAKRLALGESLGPLSDRFRDPFTRRT